MGLNIAAYGLGSELKLDSRQVGVEKLKAGMTSGAKYHTLHDCHDFLDNSVPGGYSIGS